MEVIERILEITRGKLKERGKQPQYSFHYLLFAQESPRFEYALSHEKIIIIMP